MRPIRGGVFLGIGIGSAMNLAAHLVDQTQSVDPLVLAFMCLGIGFVASDLLPRRRRVEQLEQPLEHHR